MCSSVADLARVTEFWTHVDRHGPNECWPWLGYSEEGYGLFYFTGRMRGAHELALTFTTGEKRLPHFDTCHNCNNPICCNPRHLRFDSRQSNVDDMHESGRALRGETHPASLITDQQVREMRERRAAGAQQKELAATYGISTAYVSDIVNGLCRQEAGGAHVWPQQADQALPHFTNWKGHN